METSQAKELAQRLWEQGWNQGRFEVVDEVLAADAVDRHQDHGDDFRGHLKKVIREFRTGFSDLRTVVEDIVGEGDRVAMRVVMTGTHDGVFFGILPTGNKVRVEQFHFVQVNGAGQGVRHWANTGMDDLFRQLDTTAGLPASGAGDASDTSSPNDHDPRTEAQSSRSGDDEATGAERAAAAEVLRMIWGIHISRAVYVAAELGVADLLADGPMTATQLAAATSTHESALYRVLRLLAALGVLGERPARSFNLTVLGERLRSDVPVSMRSWAMLVDYLGGVAAFEPMIEIVRTGQTGMQLAHGISTFELLSHRPALLKGFQAAMSERTAAFAPSVASSYDFSALRSIADIGGGKGTLLAAILVTHPHLRGLLFDRPQVVAQAGGVLQTPALTGRCEIVGGDFFQGVPEDADAYVLANVLHDWDDAQAVRILAACRQAMSPRSRVLIVERLIPDDPAEAVPVLLSDLNMLVFSGGRERTNAEYAQLLTAAGLRLARIQPAAAPYGIIEGLIT